MSDVGRWLVLAGVCLAVLGGILMLTGRMHLPGDLVLRRGGLTVYAPLATSLIVSIVLTVLLNLLWRAR